MVKPAAEQRGAQQRAPGGVPLALHGHVLVVAERGDHRGLDRGRHHQPGVLAHRQQLADQAGSPATKPAR